jgi:hypothetical protein
MKSLQRKSTTSCGSTYIDDVRYETLSFLALCKAFRNSRKQLTHEALDKRESRFLDRDLATEGETDFFFPVLWRR